MAGEVLGDLTARFIRNPLTWDPGAKGYWTWAPSLGIRAGGTFKIASLNKNETFSTSDLNDIGGSSGTSFTYNGVPGFGAYGEFLILFEGRWKDPRNAAVAEERMAPFIGLRYFYERSGWEINKKPDGLDSSEVTQTNSGVGLTGGIQYQKLSAGVVVLLGANATLEADAVSQSRGVLVTGVPIPSNQPYPPVQRLSGAEAPLSGVEFFLGYNLSKFFDLRLAVGTRKTGMFKDKDTYPGNEEKLSKEHRQTIKENGGMLVGDRETNEDPPDDLFFAVSGGVSF